MPEMKTTTLTYSEALDLCRSEDVAGAFMAIGERRYALRPTATTTSDLIRTESLADPGSSVAWTRMEVEALGAELLRGAPAYPHGLIPVEPWSAIALGDGRRAVRVDTDHYCWAIQDDLRYGWEDSEGIQELADEYGFTVLGDVDAARAEGRLEGLREVHDLLRWTPMVHALTPAQRQGLRGRFPEAFEEADQ